MLKFCSQFPAFVLDIGLKALVLFNITGLGRGKVQLARGLKIRKFVNY